MDFTPSDDRRMLADTLGRYVADRYLIEARNAAAACERGYSREHWQALRDLGITGALFDEAAGGFGGTGFDISTVFEGLGRGLVVEPFLGCLMAGTALARAGGQEKALGRIVSGEAIAAFAHQEPGGRYELEAVETRAEAVGDGWRLTGRKAVVPQAEAAELLVVSAWAEGRPSLFLLRGDGEGVTVRGYPNIDGGRSGEIMLDGAPAERIAANGMAAALAAYDAGLLALSAEALGIMDRLKDWTAEYLRTRAQFGVPIGKFQALQHRMATLLLEVEQARSAVINAAEAYGTPRGPRMLAAAKYSAAVTGRLVAEEAIQMHGGIGMTWELPLSHYAKRLTMIEHQLGDEDFQLERFVALGAEAKPIGVA